jgi:phosphonoacetaldehyde hydrolase
MLISTIMIRACIFDLGGTIVDRYSATSLYSLKQVFKEHHMNISPKLISRGMGLNKRNHIENIMDNPFVASNWFRENRSYASSSDIDNLFNRFNEIQFEKSKDIDILPETKPIIDLLKSRNIKTGVTTGFDLPNTLAIKNKLDKNDIQIDNYVSSTCVPDSGRPSPSMLHKNLKELEVYDSHKAIKIDNTGVGITEGKNAGCWTVGVIKWSIYMEMFEPDDINGESLLHSSEYKQKIEKTKKMFYDHGADFVIYDFNELSNTLDEIIHLNLLDF